MRIKILALLLIVQAAWSIPNPEPMPEADADAQAEAQADALPEADAQYGGMMGMGMPGGVASTMAGLYPGNGQCSSMGNQCCNFESMGCCAAPQSPPPAKEEVNCYTKYEIVCPSFQQGYCQQSIESKCFNFPMKSCRYVTDRKTVYVPKSTCRARQERVCHEYDSFECEWEELEHIEKFDWNEESLSNNPGSAQKCFQVEGCRMIEDTYNITKTVQDVDCQPYTTQVPQCKVVMQPGQSQTVTVPKWDIVYRDQCYKVPRPKCYEVPCQQTCPQPQQTCSQEQVSQTVCPISGIEGMCGDQGNCNTCQQVQVPNCGVPQNCGVPNQQCCSMTYETVCQKVPVKVRRDVTQVVPGNPVPVKQCDNVPVTRTECRPVTRPVVIPIPRKRCQKEIKQICKNFPDVPDQTKLEDQKSESKTFKYRNCNKVPKKNQFCQNVNVDVDCTTGQEPRSVIIRRQICDQSSIVQRCTTFPVSRCYNTMKKQCKYIPRKVCQKTCSQSPSCNTCANYISGSSNMPCNQCPQYYAADGGLGGSMPSYVGAVPLGGQTIDMGPPSVSG